MITAGIDAGSRAIKVVLLDPADGRVIGSGAADQGVDQQALACELFDRVLAEAGVLGRDVAGIVATGYGRNRVSFADTTVTEITCHARGVRHVSPEARTVIEIGGQDSKAIHLDPGGMVRDFAMNDRCAAGTGRFLEVVAERLAVPLAALGDLARQSSLAVAISSMCVVFAETEIIGLLASGAAPPDIVAGVQSAITRRVAALAGPAVQSPVVLTGGVAMIPGMDAALADVLDIPVAVAPTPQFTGALGAALIAAERGSR